MTQKNFYALKEDLAPMLESAERGAPLIYIPMGQFQGRAYETYSTGAQLPGLGVATMETGSSSASYLVLPSTATLVSRPVVTAAGQRYFIDQLVNPDSVTFTPAGKWGDIILAGRVATASQSQVAKSLMRRFENALKKTFVRVGAYSVGPAAKAALDAGTRLTIAEQSAPDFDLRLPETRS